MLKIATFINFIIFYECSVLIEKNNCNTAEDRTLIQKRGDIGTKRLESSFHTLATLLMLTICRSKRIKFNCKMTRRVMLMSEED